MSTIVNGAILLTYVTNCFDHQYSVLLFQIIEHNKGRLAKDRLKKEEQPRQDTVFTDKDFDVFEKEYIS